MSLNQGETRSVNIESLQCNYVRKWQAYLREPFRPSDVLQFSPLHRFGQLGQTPLPLGRGFSRGPCPLRWVGILGRNEADEEAQFRNLCGGAAAADQRPSRRGQEGF